MGVVQNEEYGQISVEQGHRPGRWVGEHREKQSARGEELHSNPSWSPGKVEKGRVGGLSHRVPVGKELDRSYLVGC